MTKQSHPSLNPCRAQLLLIHESRAPARRRARARVMGVRGLWTLIEPAGRRADVRALRGRRVAVDASIWLVQFVCAARDDAGETRPDAPARGFLRRACRLLHHGILPVFVFDGGTTALKRRTVAARARARARRGTRARRAAERVLLNALRVRALRDGVDGGVEGGGEPSGGGGGGREGGEEDEDAWERDWRSDDDGEAEAEADEEEDEEEEEIDVFVPDGESIDPEVLSALPPSVRLEVITKMRDRRVADNREHFAAAHGKMQDFSRLQLETYLKGTKLKRQIDAVMQRSDASDPSTSKRVAAQDNREFIFSGPSALRRPSGGRALALPSPSAPSALSTGAFGSNQLAGVRQGRYRAPATLVAPQEQFLVTTLHPTLPTPSVSKSVAETPITLNDEPSTLDLQISFTTENIKAAGRDPLFADPEDDAFEDVEEEEEWEDVEDDAAGASPAKLLLAAAPVNEAMETIDEDEDDDAREEDEEEDAPDAAGSSLRRKNVYSLSHGFLKGRDLGGWDAEEEVVDDDDVIVAEDEDDLDAVVALGARGEEMALAPLNENDADEQLQRAIALSIATARASPTRDETKAEMEAEKSERDGEDTKDLEAAIAMSLKEEEVKEHDAPVSPAAEAKNDEPTAAATPSFEEEAEEIDDEMASWIAAADEADRAAKRARMDKLIREAEEEQIRLQQEARQAKQGTEEVTPEMYRDVQELLTLFGIPYIIAPQEAEAQCAYLQQAKLVDAVITDDSDVFLFGATLVYRNFFQDKKYVEVYSTERIKKDLGIDRDRFIQLALLLGSDYTEGVGGVGIVNALEIVSAFRGDVAEASAAFKEWIDLEELTIVPEHLLPSPSKKQTSTEPEDPLLEAFKAKHRSLKKSWEIPENFPSREVIKAYQHPSVDKSEETFEWGKPDLDLLRLYCIKHFGWTRDATDEVLLPVMKSWSKRDSQRRIDSFFEATAAVGGRVAKFRSKRLGAAVANLTNVKPDDPRLDELLLKRGGNALNDTIVDHGDGQYGEARGDAEPIVRLARDDDDDDDALASLDLSQYSSDAKSPEKSAERRKNRPPRG